ncbi:UNVERIFIED_CONTAM: hypothetical protein Sangu_0901900 [Sesamum angustifolium]|uniref:Eukaryotic translation initiation factor-related n=1 Tax=Sesamum angustifolium TaxID=2727405 RepID=A0AAW2PC91_9LAMI
MCGNTDRTVRPVDRGGFDRQGSWGNSMGRSDHRLRPASAGSSRNLDEKTPFLSHSSHIGRNFDEDERKPLDGASGPRRTVGDDSFRAQTSRVGEPKTDNLPGARVGNRAASSPAYQISSGLPGSSYAGRAVSGSYPNAWGLGKETTIKKEPAPAAWSAPDAASKLAHASALEKVSSGRWSSKQHGPVKDAEVLGHTESEAEFEHNANNIYSKKTYNRLDVAGDSKNYDIALVMHTERSLAIDDGIHGGGKEMPTYDRARSTIRVESYERNTSVAANGFQSLHPSGKSGGTQFQSTLPSESSERPKLKLLPRSKPLENLELPVDYKQVLKERGIEDDVSNYESQPPVRVKEASPKADTFLHVTPASYSEKAEGIPTDQRIGKYPDRRDHQLNGERTDSQRRSRQNEIRRNNKDVEKHRNQQQKQPQERPLSPETWRKPVEHAKPATPDARRCDTGKQLQQLSLPRPSQNQYQIQPLLTVYLVLEAFQVAIRCLFLD